MATEALKSTAITSLDAAPPVRTTTGKGAPGLVQQVDGVITATTGMLLGSTYQMVRVPSHAKVKRLEACLDAAVTTFTVDIGVYYPTVGPLPPGIAAGAVISAALFGSAVALAAVVTPTNYLNESTSYTAAKRLQPLWQAAGLTSDPQCDLDIVMTNTATNSGTPVAYLAVEYVASGP